MPPYFNMQDVFDADLGVDGYAPTVTRSSDVVDYEFGIPSKYQRQADLLQSEADIKEESALADLLKAQSKQAYVSPEQGFATALLGIIPTVGGYMIGKSVGQPNLPAGYFEAGGTRKDIGLDKLNLGGEAGALAGLEGGLKSATNYLGALEADKAQANEVNVKLAGVRLNQAGRLQTRADQLELAGLNKEAELEMMPLREASQIRLQDNAARNSMDRALELDRLRDEREKLPPEAEAAAKRALGIPESETLTASQLRSVTAAVEAGRRQEGQEWRHEQTKGEEYVPGATILPGANPSPKGVFEAQKAVKNYNELARVHLPELKRVFSTPNVSTDEQAAALAGTVVAIKNQQNMGANFTVLEEALVKAGLPRIAEISTGSLTNFLRAELQGQDALKKIQRLEDIVNTSVDAQLNPYGYTLDRSFGAPSNVQGIPSIGGTYDGKKVTKVTKVK